MSAVVIKATDTAGAGGAAVVRPPVPESEMDALLLGRTRVRVRLE